MPIYEYYCPVCHGRFSHLAKQIDAPEPPCPRCGNAGVERMVSAAGVIHGSDRHASQLQADAAQVDSDDPQAIARFLTASGRLGEAEGVYGSKAYRELIERRAGGATDADVADLVDDLVVQMRESEASQMAGAVVFADRVENRMLAEGPPEDRGPDGEGKAEEKPAVRSRRSADDLGWG
jgi:putative FmdB family regulatory protein